MMDPLAEGAPCRFCGRSGLAWFVHSSAPVEVNRPELLVDEAGEEDGDDGDAGRAAFGQYRGVVTLCAYHERVLRAAGERGRVHGPTGVRWWLGV
jgi:hypothetical protein